MANSSARANGQPNVLDVTWQHAPHYPCRFAQWRWIPNCQSTWLPSLSSGVGWTKTMQKVLDWTSPRYDCLFAVQSPSIPWQSPKICRKLPASIMFRLRFASGIASTAAARKCSLIGPVLQDGFRLALQFVQNTGGSWPCQRPFVHVRFA